MEQRFPFILARGDIPLHYNESNFPIMDSCWIHDWSVYPFNRINCLHSLGDRKSKIKHICEGPRFEEAGVFQLHQKIFRLVYIEDRQRLSIGRLFIFCDFISYKFQEFFPIIVVHYSSRDCNKHSRVCIQKQYVFIIS